MQIMATLPYKNPAKSSKNLTATPDFLIDFPLPILMVFNKRKFDWL